jgi:hypothetical protein
MFRFDRTRRAMSMAARRANDALAPIAMGGFFGLFQLPDSLELNITENMGYLYLGANTIFEALTGPYLLIAGFTFGLMILGAIVAALKFGRG